MVMVYEPDPPGDRPMDAGFGVAVMPPGALAEIVTVPEKLLILERVIVDIPSWLGNVVEPLVIEREEGPADMLKSGGGTVTVTVVEEALEPLVPTAVTV
jgi:hypothetical protein